HRRRVHGYIHCQARVGNYAVICFCFHFLTPRCQLVSRWEEMGIYWLADPESMLSSSLSLFFSLSLSLSLSLFFSLSLSLSLHPSLSLFFSLSTAPSLHPSLSLFFSFSHTFPNSHMTLPISRVPT